MLLDDIFTGLFVMVVTTVIHALFMVLGNHAIEWRLRNFGPSRHELDRAILISLLTAWMFVAIVIEAAFWAWIYLRNPLITELPDIETAFYFSMVTFTTLGYGDVVLTGQWRTLASIQAGNGVIVFGWTTALIFFYIQKIYKQN